MTPNETADNFSPLGLMWKCQNGKTILETYWDKGIYPSTRLCKEPGCFKKHSANGFCGKHYLRASYARLDSARRARSRINSQKLKAARVGNPAWLKKQKQVSANKIKQAQREFNFKPKDEIERRFNAARYGCLKKREGRIKWLISLADFRFLCTQDCFYCGGTLGKVKFGTGLDRVDSSKDYTLGNTYSCCATCNRIKGHDLTATEAKILVETLLILRKKS